MKRDAIPSTPAPAALQPRPATRNSRHQLKTARIALLEREYRIDDLSAHIEARHPDRPLDMVRLVERLHQLGEIELVGDMLGLTDDGEAYARRVLSGDLAHQVPAHTNVRDYPTDEAGRRSRLLAGTITEDTTALTRGQRRTGASTADLADPPMRNGAQASQDTYPAASATTCTTATAASRAWTAAQCSRHAHHAITRPPVTAAAGHSRRGRGIEHDRKPTTTKDLPGVAADAA